VFAEVFVACLVAGCGFRFGVLVAFGILGVRGLSGKVRRRILARKWRPDQISAMPAELRYIQSSHPRAYLSSNHRSL